MVKETYSPIAPAIAVDVLCIGHASYDLVFSVARHPAADEKMAAERLLACGGGPAANAAVAIAKLGYSAGFSGYLGQDVYGNGHLEELEYYGVNTAAVVRGGSPTPLSVALVKPNGQRALVNYKGGTRALPGGTIDYQSVSAQAILFDGHEPQLALKFLQQTSLKPIPSVLDAGSLHDGTKALLGKVDYLVASEKFALQYSGDVARSLEQLAAIAPVVVITLGEHGLVWRRGSDSGVLPAPVVTCVDSTGAGDAFHGAFAAAIAKGCAWDDVLHYASVAGAFCCTRLGARTGLPDRGQHQALLEQWLGK